MYGRMLCLRSDTYHYIKLLEGLKSSANRGRHEHPITLTDAFDLLVRESDECNAAQSYHRHNSRRGRGSRARKYMFAQRGDRGLDHECTFSRTNEDRSREVVPGTDGISH